MPLTGIISFVAPFADSELLAYSGTPDRFPGRDLALHIQRLLLEQNLEVDDPTNWEDAGWEIGVLHTHALSSFILQHPHRWIIDTSFTWRGVAWFGAKRAQAYEEHNKCVDNLVYLMKQMKGLQDVKHYSREMWEKQQSMRE